MIKGLKEGENAYYSFEHSELVPRVTSVIGMVMVPELLRWMIKRGAERALYWRIRLTNNVESVKQAIDDVDNSAEALKGTALHQMLEDDDKEAKANA